MLRSLVYLLALGLALGSEYESEERLLLRSLIRALERRAVLDDKTKAELAEMYEDVRSGSTATTWCTAEYDEGGRGKSVVAGRCGENYDQFLETLTEDNRVYGYVRFETGDELSRRAKFAFITWIGPNVSPLKKAVVSTDKAFIKEIFSQFGKEILADEKGDVKESKVKGILEKASGAAYGTGL